MSQDYVQVQSLSEWFCLQVSQVYQTIKISNLTQMITFFDFSVVEKLVVEAVKYNFVQVKVDHLREVVSFGSQVRTNPMFLEVNCLDSWKLLIGNTNCLEI